MYNYYQNNHNNNGDKMKNEFDILNYVYKNATMGYDSTKTLLKSLENKDNKIKDVINDILKSYEQFTLESEKILERLNEKGKKYGPFKVMSADMGIIMNVMKDNSDAAIADMLIKGLTMGELEMAKLFNEKDDIDEELKDLVNDFKDFQSNAIEKLKKFI